MKPSTNIEALHIESTGVAMEKEADLDISDVSPAEARRILWKIDRRLITVVGLVYCISLLDRSNLGLARSAGMDADLQLSVGNRYSLIALIFFIPYIIFEFPSTIVIRVVGPRLFISTICLTWGILMIGCGFVRTWDALFGIRILLGTLEAGFFPGSVYLLSTWYTRYEVHKRYSFFYLFGSASASIGGMLSYGFSRMEGVGGIAGWRWIFLMEGLLTCLVAAVGFFLIVDFPEKAHHSWNFLNEREVAWVIAQVNLDRGDAMPEKFTLRHYCKQALDWKLWGFGMLFFCVLTNSYALSFFLPTILGSMGYNSAESQYLTAPPYAAAGFMMLGTAWLGDKYHMRSPIIVFNCIVTVVGLALMGYIEEKAVRYFGVFLFVCGSNSNIPSIMAYQANNIVGQAKRAMASALLVGLGGVGGIAGSLIFRAEDKPGYRPGIIACFACNGLLVTIVICLTAFFASQNKKQKRGEIVIEGTEGFRYTL